MCTPFWADDVYLPLVTKTFSEWINCNFESLFGAYFIKLAFFHQFVVKSKISPVKQSIQDFISKASEMNPNEPEFIQAVTEVAETVIPFIEANEKYQGKMLLERMI